MQNTSNGMATASLVIGIIGLLTMCCGGSIVFGSLAIILALLSRGAGSMQGQARAGFGIGIAGIALGIAIIAAVVFFYINSGNFQSTLDDYLQYYQDQYGDSDDFENPYNYTVPGEQSQPDTGEDAPL